MEEDKEHVKDDFIDTALSIKLQKLIIPLLLCEIEDKVESDF